MFIRKNIAVEDFRKGFAAIPYTQQNKSEVMVQSLMLGLMAALLWGLHDFIVRKVGPKADAAALLLIVIGAGALVLAPLCLILGGWHSLTPAAVWLCLGAGLAYAFAGYGLYSAFTIGPVRLVAPICGAFPLLSVGFAMARGAEGSALVWLGAVAVLGGIALVAQGETDAAQGSRGRAIVWSVMACFGFAATFGLLQWASEYASAPPVLLLARLACFAIVLAFVALRRIPIAPALAQSRALLLMGALDVSALGAVTWAGGFARPEFASVSSSIFGMITILLAWRFLREPMLPLQWLGAGVVFSGIAVLGLV